MFSKKKVPNIFFLIRKIPNNDIWEPSNSHMGDFTQPQQKYASTSENCNIAIPVIFYPVIKTL